MLLHYVRIKKQKVTMTGWKSPEFSFLELNGKEAVIMSSFEIISMIQQMLIVLVSFGQLIIALLSFSDRKRKH
jgi:hypothetical protein